MDVEQPPSNSRPSRPTDDQDGPRFCVVVKQLSVTHHQRHALCGSRPSESSVVAVDNVSFVAPPGRVLAVVGAEGSGRASLLNALAGRLPKSSVSGTVRAVLQEDSPQPPQSGCCRADCSASFAFVNEGDDHFLPNLTVFESLMYIARLKLPTYTKDELKARVDWVLESAYLSNCRNVFVGNAEHKGISTGERRRLLIAAELLDWRKRILFLDKPTIGIDSAQAREVVEVLRSLARSGGRTVVLSLHQPTTGILEAVDDILLLHRGKCIFLGPVASMNVYFERVLGRSPAGEECFIDGVLDELAFADGGMGAARGAIVGQGEAESAAQESIRSGGVEQPTQSVDEWPQIFEATEYGAAAKDDLAKASESPQRQLSSRTLPISGGWDGWKHFWLTVLVVWKRFTKNAFRNPYMLAGFLLACLQGLLMGGIMFDYRGSLPRERTYEINTLFPEGSLSETTLGHLAISGLSQNSDGTARRPLFDVLQFGVDGNGSKPLIDFVTYDNNRYWFRVRDSMRCLRDQWDLGGRFGYPVAYPPWEAPTEPSPSTEEPTTSMESPARHLSAAGFALKDSLPLRDDAFDFNQLQGDLVTTLQTLDFIWSRIDWSHLEFCNEWLPEPEFYFCLLQEAGCMAVDATQCFDLPSLRFMFDLGVELLYPPVFLEDGTAGTEPWGVCGGVEAGLPSDESRRFESLDSAPWDSERSETTLLKRFPSRAGRMLQEEGDIYDQDIMHWDSSIAEREWAKVHSIIEGLLGDISLLDAARLLVAPQLRGDLTKLSDYDRLRDVSDFFAEVYNWLQNVTATTTAPAVTGLPSTTETPLVGTTEEGILPAQQPSPSRQLQSDEVCTSPFCSDLKTTVMRYLRRSVNRLKIDVLQKEFPRIVVSAWMALALTGCLFATVAALGFFCFDTLLAFHKDRTMFNREEANGLYTTLGFYLGKNIADLPFQLIPSLCLTLIWGAMAGSFVTASEFGVYFALIALCCFAACGFCYMVSALTPRMEVAIVVAPLALISWLILAGFIMRENSLIPTWLVWYRHISLHRFTWFSLSANAFPLGGSFGDMPNEAIHSLMGIQDLGIGKFCLLLALLGVVYRVAAFFFLKFLYRNDGVLQR